MLLIPELVLISEVSDYLLYTYKLGCIYREHMVSIIMLAGSLSRSDY